MGYFLPDALGSVRQLADNAGAVTLAERYDPFGGALTSAGSGTSEFGFAGEQTDASGMEYLRARYYAPGQGRFATRDTWDGDINLPMSHNGWSYAYDNPVNQADPSGRSPDELGIREGKFSYSCFCGWIDWGHASPRTAKDILKKVYYDPPLESSPVRGVSKGYKAIYVEENEGFDIGPMPIRVGVADVMVVRRSLSLEDKKKVALGIFMALSDKFENFQDVPFFNESAFAEEDLASDLIGFYVAVQLTRPDGSDVQITAEQEKALVHRPCGIPVYLDLDTDPSSSSFQVTQQSVIQWSLDVFNEPYGQFEKVHTWERPRLMSSCLIDTRCGLARSWPAEYRAIRPEGPAVNGKWWEYRGNGPDGARVQSDRPGVYYILPGMIE